MGIFHFKNWQKKTDLNIRENIVTTITILYSVQAAAVKEGSSDSAVEAAAGKEGSSDSDSDFAFGVEPLHI